MRLVPYTYSSVKRNDKVLHTIRVLMEGQQVWKEDIEDPNNALEPNELVAKSSFQEGEYQYFGIDQTKTDLTSMYSYAECDPDTDMLCWRTFYVITDLKGDYWINIPNQQSFLTPILKAHYV